MKKIRLFAIIVFILSVNIPLAYSLVEPIRSMEEATSKLLVQKERNSSLNIKIAHRQRRLGRKSFRRKTFRVKSFKGRSFRGRSFRGRSPRVKSRRKNSISTKMKNIRSKFSRRIHSHS